MKAKNIHQYSRFTDNDTNLKDGITRTIHNLLKKSDFEKENTDWLSELSAVIKKTTKTFTAGRKC